MTNSVSKYVLGLATYNLQTSENEITAKQKIGNWYNGKMEKKSFALQLAGEYEHQKEIETLVGQKGQTFGGVISGIEKLL